MARNLAEVFSRGTALKDWSLPWSRSRALAVLCVPGEVYRERNVRERVEARLEAAFDGRIAPIQEIRELGQHAAPLIDGVDRVGAAMGRLGLPSTLYMHPVLWIRLMRQADVVLDDGAYRRLGEWRLYTENQGAAVFTSENSEYGDVAVDKNNTQKEVGIYKYTIEEILLRPSKGNLPFARPLKLIIIPRATNSRANSIKEVKYKNSIKKEKAKKSKPKTINYFEKICGSGVMSNLLLALTQESRSSKKIVKANGESKFYTNLPAAEVIGILRKNQRAVLTGSDSTLRKAMAAYVVLPRGKPSLKQTPILRAR